MSSSTPPVHVPEDVAAYFRAGGRIVATYYRHCPKHGYTRSKLAPPKHCLACNVNGRR
jgi:hypothetical protein